MEVTPGELVVARLWRWNIDQLRSDAEKDHAERLEAGESDPQYSVSAWAWEVPPDGDAEAAITTLFRHVAAYRSARWAAVTTERRLLNKGFPIEASGPYPGHYDVLLGTNLEVADLVGLEAVFNEDDRRRFQ